MSRSIPAASFGEKPGVDAAGRGDVSRDSCGAIDSVFPEASAGESAAPRVTFVNAGDARTLVRLWCVSRLKMRFFHARHVNSTRVTRGPLVREQYASESNSRRYLVVLRRDLRSSESA